MDRDRWAQAEKLFHEAVDLAPDARAEFLDRRCPDDTELRRLVETLLEGDADNPSILEVDGPALFDRLGHESDTDDRPASFGPYEIIEPIGRGGMGVVYLARRADGQFDRTVALKVVGEARRGDEARRWFRAEARILARLEHPRIARLYDVGVEDDQAYIVMEFVDGERLDRYADARRLDIDARLRLFLQVCEAVAYAHQHLVVHRDLKPSNILVSADGTVRLLDFGISSLLAEGEGDGDTAEASIRALTPRYSSPEQLGGAPATTASDLYSLGVVLYELLTGGRPYDDTTDRADLARAVTETDAAAPSRSFDAEFTHSADPAELREARAASRSSTPRQLARALEGDLDAIVLKALQRDPARRYASVGELADDIQRHLKGLPVEAMPDTTAYRARKFARRNAFGVAASAAVFVGLAGGLAVAIWQAREAATQRDVAIAETAKAERMRDFLMGIFMSADPSEARADTITGIQILDRGAVRIRAELETEPEVRAAMLDVIGQVYTNLGQFERAETLLTEGRDLREQLFGPRSVEVARSIGSLAALERARESSLADSLSAEALELLLEALGPDDADVARAFVNTAQLVREVDADSADVLLDRAEHIYSNIDGGHAVGRASLDYVRAFVLQGRGEYDRAAELYRRALGVQTERLGSAHPLTLTTQHSLGYLMQVLGRYPSADSALSGVLEARRRVYGENHPRVANTLWALADLRYEEGRLEEAEALTRQVLAIRSEIFDDDSGTMMGTRLLLASILHSAGRTDEAAELFETVVAHAEASGRQIAAARALNNYAGVLESKGDLPGAEELYRRSWSAYSEAWGPTHPFAAIVQGNLASTLMVQGDLDAAEPLNLASLEILRDAYGDEHPTVAVSRMQLGALYCARGDVAAGEPLLRDALSTLEQALPQGHWRLGQARLRLGTCLRAAGREDEAERELVASRGILEPRRYVNRGDWTQLLSELHELYTASGRPAEADRIRRLFRATTGAP